MHLGVFLDARKIGTIVICLMTGDRDLMDVKSYRSITLTVFGKIIERLTMHIDGVRSLSSKQYGFVRNRSVEDAVVRMRDVVKDSDSNS